MSVTFSAIVKPPLLHGVVPSWLWQAGCETGLCELLHIQVFGLYQRVIARCESSPASMRPDLLPRKLTERLGEVRRGGRLNVAPDRQNIDVSLFRRVSRSLKFCLVRACVARWFARFSEFRDAHLSKDH